MNETEFREALRDVEIDFGQLRQRIPVDLAPDAEYEIVDMLILQYGASAKVKDVRLDRIFIPPAEEDFTIQDGAALIYGQIKLILDSAIRQDPILSCFVNDNWKKYKALLDEAFDELGRFSY